MPRGRHTGRDVLLLIAGHQLPQTIRIVDNNTGDSRAVASLLQCRGQDIPDPIQGRGARIEREAKIAMQSRAGLNDV